MLPYSLALIVLSYAPHCDDLAAEYLEIAEAQHAAESLEWSLLVGSLVTIGRDA